MSSNYGSCCYLECTNSYSTNSNSAFFKFPNDDARRKKWIANCGNPEIAQLSDRHLRGKRICALHFADNSFTDSSKKDVLTDKAIPLKFKKAKSPEPEETTPAKKPRGRAAAAAGKTPEPVVTQTPVKPRRGSEASSTEATTSKSEKQKQAQASTKEKETVVNEAKADVKSSAPQLRGKSTRRISETSTETTNKAEKQQKSMPVLVKETTISETKTDEKSSSPQLRGKSRRGSETAAAATTTEATNKPEKPKSAPTLVKETTIHEAKTKTDNVRAGSTSPQRKAKEGKQRGSQVLETPPAATAPTASAIVKREPIAEPEFKEGEHKACIIPHIHSKFGKALHSFLNDLLNDGEPSIKKERQSSILGSRTSESLNDSSSIDMKVAASRVPFEQIIKSEKIVQKLVKHPRPSSSIKPRTMQFQKLNQQAQRANNIGHQGQAHATPEPQYVTYDTESGNLVIQNNDGSGGVGPIGEFTLAEGEEYEVIGESDALESHQHHHHQLNHSGGSGHGHHAIQVVEANENNNDTIEIIEVDDQTMAQLTGQNVFFPNSGNIQVTELDPNLGQILKVINPSDGNSYSYHHSSSQ